mmetsp:Transcript_15919/g.24586  ORF Transcript_15919/g.24586 Transcript_15919/m.24586 type:complete len:89 (+) Transcript_15919:2182-2448(+)
MVLHQSCFNKLKIGVVDTAHNGQEAVDKCGAKEYDLIITDLGMPVMDGFEATKRIREMKAHKNTVIVALSAQAFSHELLDKCCKLGFS